MDTICPECGHQFDTDHSYSHVFSAVATCDDCGATCTDVDLSDNAGACLACGSRNVTLSS